MEDHKEARRVVVEAFYKRGLVLDKAALELLLSKRALNLTDFVEHLGKKVGQSTLFVTREMVEEALLQHNYTDPEGGVGPASGSTKFLDAPPGASIMGDVKVLFNVEKLDRPSDDVDLKRSYLSDRFRKLERILRSRLDVNGLYTIPEARKLPDKTKAKIIAMILEAKTNNYVLLEDLRGSAYLTIPRKASDQLRGKARRLHTDLVACFEVVVLGGRLVCTDIILPDIPDGRPNKATDEVCAVLTSDLHVGSSYFMEKTFQLFLKWLRGEAGSEESRKLARKVRYLVIAGDIVDGVGVYPQQERELTIRNVVDQYKRAAELLKQVPDHINVIIIPGNHDATRKALPQPPISGEYAEPLLAVDNVILLSNPSVVSLHGVKLLLTHGTSLEDLANHVPEFHHSHAEVAMGHLLAVRHIAPIYGGRTPIQTDGEDKLVIAERPDIFHAGHIHVYKVGRYRGVVIANTGTWQSMTPYQQALGFVPTPGIFSVVHLDSLNLETIPIVTETRGNDR